MKIFKKQLTSKKNRSIIMRNMDKKFNVNFIGIIKAIAVISCGF